MRLNIILMSFVFLTSFSCKENPYAPPTEDQPGRRNYNWMIDTIKSSDSIYRLWGNSPNNLWAINTGGNPYESIFHFDGIKWSTDGVFRLISPGSIWGFSNDEVYIGGNIGDIWHYNGINWKEFARLNKDGHNDIAFNNLWGEFPNDFYALGAYPDTEGYLNNSVIAHFSDGSWNLLNTNGLFGIIGHLYRNKPDNKIYLRIIGGRNYTDSTHIYEYTNGQYNRLYSNIWTQGLQADISLINGEVYFVLGREISKRVNNQFQTILKVDNPNFYQRIWGRNSKDIFLLMTDGLAHYNGTDTEYLFYFKVTPRTQIFGAALFEKDVFFLVGEAGTNLNLIYHGKLN